MNANCFKTVFSERLGCLVAVGEHACSQGKSSGESAFGRSAFGASVLASASVFIGALVLSQVFVGLAWAQPAANALPTGGTVVQGAASLAQSANQLNITQSTQRAAINWQSFDIGASAKVNVVQPNAQAVLLNPVVGQSPSQIFGQLQANGHVILVNPNGVLFGKDGSVNAGSFTASTLGITDANFMAGNMVYERNGSTAGVVNQGTIEVSPGGYVALLGASVSNEGKIIAPKGGVALGAAETIKVPVTGSGRIKLELTAGDINASVKNSGAIVSEGGQVYMQALALNRAAAQILQSGRIDTTGEQGGAVHLLADGGTIKVDGSITANSTGQDDKGQVRKGGDIVIGRDEETGALAKTTVADGAQLESRGGFVETSGDVLSTTGTRVKAAEWLLDPYNITIADSAPSGTTYSSNYTSAADSVILASDIAANLDAGTSVTLATGAGGASAGDINVNASIAKTAGGEATLTLKAHNDIVMASNTTITSTAGKLNVVLNSDSDGSGAGAILMNTGSGITSLGGNITLGGGSAGDGSGAAMGNATRPHGIAMVGASLSSGAGHVKLTGASHTGGNSVYGMDFGGSSTITTTSGNVDISATGRTNGQYGYGMMVNGGSKITTDTGHVTINALSSDVGSSDAVGIQIRTTGAVTTNGGNIAITGASRGAAGQYNTGITFNDLGSVVAGGSGTVTLTGSGGSAGSSSLGVSGARVTTAGGAVNITASTLAGAAGSVDVWLNSVNTSGGNLTVVANSYSGGGTEVVNAGSGTVTLQNRTAGTLLDVGGTSTDVLTGSLKLGISAAELGRITAGNVVLGRSDSLATGNVTVNAINLGALGNTSGNLTVRGNQIAVNDNVIKTAGNEATLSLQARADITMAADKTIQSTSGELNVTMNANLRGTGGGIVLNTGSGVTSNGGDIHLRGGGNATAAVLTQLGISMTGANLIAGGGSITLEGRSNDSSTVENSHGIGITNSSSITTTGSGSISISGTNATAASARSKSVVISDSKVTGCDTGTVSIAGDSSASTTASDFIYGTLLNGSTEITTTGANINITGLGGGSGSTRYHMGIEIVESAKVIAGGTGTVSLTGTGGKGTGGWSWGIHQGGSSTVASNGGAVSLTGIGGAGGDNFGVTVGSTAKVGGLAAAPITITTDSISLGGSVDSGTGLTTIQNRTTGTLIRVGGADNLSATTGTRTLGVDNSEINRVTAGTLKIGSLTSGNTTVSAAVDTVAGAAVTGNLYVLSGGTLTASAAATSEKGLFLQTNGGAISATAALKGSNVSLDNTNGVIDFSTGSITAGTATNTNASAAAIRVASTSAIGIEASGNINVLGVNAGTQNAVELNGVVTMNAAGTAIESSTSEIKATSASSVINITGNTIVNNTAVLTTTSNGASINLTSTSGGVTGTGSIGSTTYKGASGTFNSATTSSYSGAINATNFTKAGLGRLTLNSWAVLPFSSQTPAQTAALTTNISNAYTVRDGGELNLNTGAPNYMWIAPASLNVNNASIFSIEAASNGRWNNTSFNFTGGLGGGTMNLGGNPIGASGTTNIFSTSGGATNIINGGFNSNSGSVTLSLASATSGTQLLDGSFAAINFANGFGQTANFGLSNTNTVNVGGGGSLLVMDKIMSTNFNVNAGSVQFGTGDAETASTTPALNATNVNIASGASLTFNKSVAYTNSSGYTGSGNLIQAGAGTMTLTGNSAAFAGATTVNAGRTLAIGTGGSLGASGSTITLADSASRLSFTNTSGSSTVGSNIIGSGALIKSGVDGTGVLTGTNSYAGTTTISGGTLQVGNSGSTGTLGVGDVVLSNNATLSYVRSVDTTIANSIAGTGSVSANITGTGSDLTVSSAISLTAGTVNLAADGNLSVTQGVSTTNTTSTALVLNAGKTTAAGTASGGDISISGGGGLTVGTGGRATLYTGSLQGSTGLGVSTGNNRYNSDEQTSNFSAALGSGSYAIYRQAPTLSVRFNDASKTYNAQAFTGGAGLTQVSGFVNGDTDAQLGSISYSGTSQNAVNAGSYVISGTALSGLGYALAYTNGGLTIGKADLTLTGSKVYDAGTTFAGQHLTATGVAGQTFSLTGSGDASNLASQNVQTNQALSSITGLALGSSTNGGLAANYNDISTTGSSVSVTPRTLTVTGANTSVTYNGSAQTNAAANLSGIQGTDSFTVSGYGTGTNASTTAYADSLSVSAVGSTLLSNYDIRYTNGGLTIGKANLTLSGSKVYDAGTTFAGQYLTATGVAGQTFSITGSGDASNLASKNVQTNQALSSVTGLALGSSTNGGLAANYNDISTTGSSVSVTPRTLTVTGANTSVTYNGSAQTNAAATIAGNQGTDSFTVSGYGTGTNASTTAYADSLSLTGTNGTLLSNYNISYTNGGLTIGKADLTLSGSKIYDADTTFEGQHLTATGVAGQTFLLTGSGDASNLASKNVQTNQALSSVTGLALGSSTNGGLAANYNDISTTGSSVSVTPRTLTVTGANTSVTYNGSAQTNAAATIAGNQGTDSFTVSGYGTGTNASTTAYADSLSLTGTNGTLLSNYNISYTNGGLTIGKAQLTATGNSSNVTYNGANQSVSGFTVTGLQGSDTVADLTSVQAAGVTGKNAGTYTNAVTAGTETNYTVSAVDGTLNIGKAQLTATGNSSNVTYNGTNQTVTGFTVTGLQVTDTVTDLTTVVAVGATGKNAGTYTNALSAGTETNYTVTAVNGLLTIDKANLTLSGTRIYDAGTTFAGQYLRASGVAGETFTVTGSGDVTNLSSKNVQNAQSLSSVAGLSLGSSINGGLVSNYKPLSTVGSSVSITPKPLSASGAVADKIYDGTLQAILGDLGGSGVVPGDGVVFKAISALFADKNVARDGSGLVQSKAVTVSGLSLEGADAGNYQLSANSFTTQAKILPKTLTAPLSVQNKTYDGNTSASVSMGALSGLVGAESIQATAWGLFDSATAGSNKPVLVRYRWSDGANGGLASNYELPSQTLTASILSPSGGNPVQPMVVPTPSAAGGLSVMFGAASGVVELPIQTASSGNRQGCGGSSGRQASMSCQQFLLPTLRNQTPD